MSEDEQMTFGDVTGAMAREREIQIDYTNHRGERRWRRIVPFGANPLVFGTSPDHKEPQWLLTANDVEKGALRTFSLRTIHAIKVGE